jgi:hypothetical protein
VDADAELDLVGPRSNSGEPFAGGVQAVSATPMVRVTELTFCPMRTSSSRSAPSSEAAPTAFMTKKFPATPRGPRCTASP